MRKIILSVFLISFLVPLFAQEGRIYIELQKNNGQWVDKSEIWYEYTNTGKKVHKKIYYEDEEWLEYDNNDNLIYQKRDNFEYWWEYDSHNNLVYSKIKSSDRLEENSYQNEYDSLGRLIYIKDLNPNHKDWNIYEQWFKYDESGNKIYYKNKYDQTFYEYDKNNNLTVQNFNNFSKTIYSYDSRNNKIYSSSYGKEKFYSYDYMNNLTYSYEGEDEYWYEYEYDSKGNITCKTTKYYTMKTGESGLRYRSAFNCKSEWFEYDKNNNVIHYKDSTTYEKWYIYEYDSSGRIVHEICYSRN